MYYEGDNLPALAAKDDLTLMLRQLHPKTGEFDVFEAFSKAGKVDDTDENLGRCYRRASDDPSQSLARQIFIELARLWQLNDIDTPPTCP